MMKQPILITYLATTAVQRLRTVVLAALLLSGWLLPAGCTNEFDVQQPSDPALPATDAPVCFTVTDGGYVSGSSGTRAVDVGYTTRFVKGDTIGVYMVTRKSGYFWRARTNIFMVFNGTEWKVDPDENLVYTSTDSLQMYYFAYYPFRRYGGLSATYSRLDTARDFFRNGIDSWVPALDQSTQKAYTGSDLMIAKGEVTPRADGDGYNVSFRMEHQMALAVVDVPPTEYRYIASDGTDRNYRQYTGLNPDNGGAFLLDGPCTGRYLIKPGAGCTATYYDSGFKKRSFHIATNTDQAGSYVRYVVDNADDPVSPIDRRLRIGDFYMRDGGILPREFVEGTSFTLPAGRCIGLVFSTDDPTLGDPLLRRDHPTCNHGIVIALTDASAGTPWSLTTEMVNNWTNHADRGGNRVDIGGNAVMNSRRGYSNTYALRLFNAANPNRKVLPVSLIDSYAPAAPPGSSGWYWPGGELFDKTSLETVNALFPVAGGEALSNLYWISGEFDARSAWSVYSSALAGVNSVKTESKACSLRPFCAF